jgi:predicted nuclease of predicted toxin-antitoxin system
MEPRFLIDENLSPQLARHLRFTFGFDAVHVSEVGLAGASDTEVLAHAIAEHRLIMTSNGADFRKLGRRHPRPPGLVVFLSAVGRARQIVPGEILANAVHAEIDRGARLTDGCSKLTPPALSATTPCNSQRYRAGQSPARRRSRWARRA